MKVIKLDVGEYSALESAAVHNDIADMLRPTRTQEGYVYIEASLDELDELREACSDYLNHSGFNDDYTPNELGDVLESLIDKLYVP